MKCLLPFSVWVAAALAVALVITASGASNSSGVGVGDATPVRLPPTPGLSDPPDPGGAAAAEAPGPPQVSPADLAASEAILASDPGLRSLLGSIQYSVTGSQPWSTPSPSGSGHKLTELEVQLDSPLSARDAVLPGVRFDPGGSSYQQLELHAAIEAATTLTVLVDQTSAKVVSVLPPDSTLTELPGNIHSPPGD